MNAKTRLQVSKSALEHNFQFLKNTTGNGVKLMAVVKANGYGTDLINISKWLVALGADALCVAYTPEGISLRRAGITLPILVLHPQIEDLGDAIAEDLSLSIYSIPFLEAIIQFQPAKKIDAHLNLNTGLNRLGIKPKEINKFLSLIKEHPVIDLSHVMTHLIGSEDEKLKSINKNQLKVFEQSVKVIEQTLGKRLKKHALNSSGVLNYPEAHFDMVRCGIALHGYANDPVLDKQLKPISTLFSHISDLRVIEKGESVSYNRQFIAKTPMTIATIPLGHADGFIRDLGNGRGKVLINGQLVPVVGMVCMDLFVVDVSRLKVSVGEEVVVMGKGLTAEMLAQQSGTIAYELLTGIGSRIPRVFI
jgi:alanine racemase